MPLARAFACAECGNPAGSVTVHEADPAATDPRARVEVTGAGMSITFYEARFAAIRAALEKGSEGAVAAAMYARDPELVPAWCPRCRASYCAAHWTIWDTFDEGFHDATYGRCPRDHERMLAD